jgi:hypothetical protein
MVLDGNFGTMPSSPKKKDIPPKNGVSDTLLPGWRSGSAGSG